MQPFCPAYLCSLALLLAPGTLAGAAHQDIVFLAPTSSAMPFARFHEGILESGIIKDLGQAIAAKLGRCARFISLPGKRVESALAAGQADGVCNVMPGWINGNFAWSQPLIANAGVVISRRDAARITALEDLAGQRVGTVLGYKYPALEAVMGTLFTREDAASMQLVFRKMEAGRNQHAIGERRPGF